MKDLVLAPMVRIGSLPMRLLALRYGADYVFSPEIVDKSIIGSTRIVHTSTNTVDYVKEGRVIFRTCLEEKTRLIVQIGTSDSKLAVEAAKVLQNDCIRIDVNCGCPKKFSTHSGMGAILLETPEKLGTILTSLVGSLNIPVSAKIRLLPSHQETENVVRRILQTGIEGLTIHGRTRLEAYETSCDWKRIKELSKLVKEIDSRVRLYLSGDVFNRGDLDTVFKYIPELDGVMLARAAQWNVSVFSKGPLASLDQVMQEFLIESIRVNNNHNNAKYGLVEMLIGGGSRYRGLLQRVFKCKGMEDLVDCFGLGPEVLNRTNRIGVGIEEEIELGYTKEKQDLHLEHKVRKVLYQ